MAKILKLLSIRTIKSLILNFLAKNPELAMKFKIFNKSINYHQVVGENILDISNENGSVFFAKKFSNILVAENTGCSLCKIDNFYQVIDNFSGNVHKNWVKFSWQSSSVKRLDGISINLIGVHKGSKHYFHIFFDYFYPLIFLLKNYDFQDIPIKILVRANFNEVQKQLHEVLENNFSNIKFVYVDKNEFIECENLIFFKHFHNNFYDHIHHKKISEIINFLRDILLKKYQILTANNLLESCEKKMIYITRKKARLRQTINEKSVIKNLQKRGFEVIELEGLSLKKQIEIFYQAKLIIATHGAGFTNLIFASNNLFFLEIFSKKYGSKDFIRIANLLDLKRYEYRENNEFIWQYFYIHLNKILPIIDELILKINEKN